MELTAKIPYESQVTTLASLETLVRAYVNNHEGFNLKYHVRYANKEDSTSSIISRYDVYKGKRLALRMIILSPYTVTMDRFVDWIDPEVSIKLKDGSALDMFNGLERLLIYPKPPQTSPQPFLKRAAISTKERT